jgi:hypothetical protein
MSYVYMRSEAGLYTVGFYAPDGGWNPESDYGSKEDAAARVHYLNGGGDIDADDADLLIEQLCTALRDIAVAIGEHP